MNNKLSNLDVSALAFLILFLLFGGVGGCMYGMPKYQVYEQRKHGEAELARAESNRQIALLEARAKYESSKCLADAEIIRAEGIAKANLIIGDSLKDNEGYLRYLWIDGVAGQQNQIIYIPTEANLPILEASRMKK